MEPLGDAARLPYGTQSGDTVTRYAVQAARALIARDIKMLVVACNTAASVALPVLQTTLAPLPVIGVIAPGAAAAVAAAKEGPIAVIATEGTVKGGAYVQAIQALAPRMPVVQQAAPLLVPLAEEGLVTGEIARLAVERYLKPLLATLPRPRALVLGCTHFPALKDMPVLGALFRSRDYQNDETEMVVIISAYLVEPNAQSAFAAPTDGFVPASDPETLLLGRLNAVYKDKDKPAEASAAAPVGFIVQ